MKRKKGLAALNQDFITENIIELQKYHQAFLYEQIMKVLHNKGFTFDSAHDVKMMFKNRLRAVNYENGESVMLLDDQPICSYKTPIFKETDVIDTKHEISIKFEFTPL